MYETVIARDMYDHPGALTTMRRGVRRWRDRPALAPGQEVTIVRLAWESTPYGSLPRVLVRTRDDAARWVDGADIEPVPMAGAVASECVTGEQESDRS